MVVARCKLVELALDEERSDRVAAVVVTFNRKDMLLGCVRSLLTQTHPVEHIVLVDNATTDGTPELLGENGYLAHERIEYVRLFANSGGSGGFHEGVRRAFATGCKWVWIMDDDVEPYPDALATMLSYSSGSGCIHGAEIFLDGQRLEWERWATITESGERSVSLEAFQHDCISVSVGCFEGMLIRRDIVSKIGLPDRRFFIGGDDVAYGYLASKHTKILYTRRPCFIKKAKAMPSPTDLLAKVRNRFQNHRSRRFYFLAVRNELLLHNYTRSAVKPFRFYARIIALLLRLSLVTVICERRLDNCILLWKGTWRGLSMRWISQSEFDVKEIPT